MSSDTDSSDSVEGVCRIVGRNGNYEFANILTALCAAAPCRSALANHGQDLVPQMPWQPGWYLAQTLEELQLDQLDTDACLGVMLQLYSAALTGHCTREAVCIAPLEVILDGHQGSLASMDRIPQLESTLRSDMAKLNESDGRVVPLRRILLGEQPVDDDNGIHWWFEATRDKGWVVQDLAPVLCVSTSHKRALDRQLPSDFSAGQYVAFSEEALSELRQYSALVEGHRILQSELRRTEEEAEHIPHLREAAASVAILDDPSTVAASAELRAKAADIESRVEYLRTRNKSEQERRLALLGKMDTRASEFAYRLVAVATQRGVALVLGEKHILLLGTIDEIVTTDDLEEALQEIDTGGWGLGVYVREGIEVESDQIAPSISKFLREDSEWMKMQGSPTSASAESQVTSSATSTYSERQQNPETMDFDASASNDSIEDGEERSNLEQPTSEHSRLQDTGGDIRLE